MSDSKKKRPDSKVTLIEDPYSFSTLEIQEAQASEDELDLDEAPEEAEASSPERPVDLAAPVSQEEFDRLAEAVAKADAETASESEAEPESEADAEAELAAQIAEDQALQAE